MKHNSWFLNLHEIKNIKNSIKRFLIGYKDICNVCNFELTIYDVVELAREFERIEKIGKCKLCEIERLNKRSMSAILTMSNALESNVLQ